MEIRNRRLWIISSVIAVTILISLAACSGKKKKTAAIPRETESIPVKLMNLEKTSGNSVITTSGNLTTDDQTTLSFKVGGVVSSVLVKEGDIVRRGQLLATIDFTEVNSQVGQIRVNLDKAQRDYQRLNNLYKDSVATLEQLQNGQSAVMYARQQLQAAQFNRAYAEIHAVTDGYVLTRFVNPGQVVAAGTPVMLTNGALRNQWILRTGVSDKQWASINIKDRATVRIDAFPDKVFQAWVKRKAEISDPQTGAFTVELAVESEGVKFATGMFGAATIQSGAPRNLWQIPHEALLDANGSKGWVFITTDNKKAVKQAVTIESFSGNYVLISEGLENANALIVSGSAYLADQSPITILK